MRKHVTTVQQWQNKVAAPPKAASPVKKAGGRKGKKDEDSKPS